MRRTPSFPPPPPSPPPRKRVPLTRMIYRRIEEIKTGRPVSFLSNFGGGGGPFARHLQLVAPELNELTLIRARLRVNFTRTYTYARVAHTHTHTRIHSYAFRLSPVQHFQLT